MLKVLHSLPLPGDKSAHTLWLPDSTGLLLATFAGLTYWRWPEPPRCWPGPAGSIGALMLAPDGHTAWATGPVNTASLQEWNLETGSYMPYQMPPAGTVCSLALDAESRKLYFGTKRGEVGWWDLDSRQLSLLPVSVGQQVTYLALDTGAHRLAWLEDGVQGATVYLWDLNKQVGILTYDLKNTGRLLRCEADYLIWGECGKNIRLYYLPLAPGKPPAKTRIPQTEFKLHRRPVMALALSPDRALAASGSTSNEPGIMIWDARSSQLLEHYTENITPTSLAFSPDGRQLAVTGTLGVQVLALA